MDFDFSDEEKDFRSTVRRWVQDKYPKTKVNLMERQEDHDGSHFPREFVSGHGRRRVPRHRHRRGVGGQGGGATIQAILMDEMARSPRRALLGLGDQPFNAKSIQQFAKPDLRDELLPQMVAGEKLVGDRGHRARRRHRPARRRWSRRATPTRRRLP